MIHYLFVNEKGRKFKTTATGKKQIEKSPKLRSRTKYIGECNEFGVLITEIQPSIAVTPIKQFIQAPEVKAEIKEEKFIEEEPLKTRKYVKKVKGK